MVMISFENRPHVCLHENGWAAFFYAVLQHWMTIYLYGGYVNLTIFDKQYTVEIYANSDGDLV